MSGFIFKQLQIIKYEMESELFWEIQREPRESFIVCLLTGEINSSWRRLWWEAAPRPLMSSSAQAAGRTSEKQTYVPESTMQTCVTWPLTTPKTAFIFNDMHCWVPTWSSCLFFKWNFWGNQSQRCRWIYMNHNEAPTTALLQCFRLLDNKLWMIV